MRRTTTAKQRCQKILFLLLLLPVVGLGFWGLLALSGPDRVQPGAGYTGGTLVESSSLRRNNIYDRNFDLLALSFRLSSLYARPLEIDNPEGTAAELARLLGLDRDELLASLRSERSFVWLTRQVEKEVMEEILAHGFRGVYAMPRSHRYYPHHHEAAHAIGFVKDEQGLAGIELSYDNILRGGISDVRLAAADIPDRVTAGGGMHLVSTLDLSLQREMEQRLARVLRAVDGHAASALVMDVRSGAVLAMVSLPAYDPNRYWDAGPEERLNRTVVPRLRPGGLREIFRRAAAIGAEQATDSGDSGRPTARPDQGEVDQGEVDQGEEEGRQRQGWWHELEPEVYVSSSLKLADRAASLQSNDFLELVGLCRPSDLDLLEGRSLAEIMQIAEASEEDCHQLFADSRLTVNGVSLLAAFSRLVSSGRPVEPHLIGGFWDGEQFWARQSAVARGAVPAATGRIVLDELVKMAGGPGGHRGVATYETLVVQGRSRERAGEAAGFADHREPGLVDLPAGEQATTVDTGAADQPRYYQAVQLSMAPVEDPALAALVFIDGARLDLELPSPLAGVVRDLDTWSGKLRRSPAPPAADSVLAREDSLYRQWLGRQEKGELRIDVAAGQPPERMPEVVGLSLRKALQVLQPSGLRIQVAGSGRVVSQQPAAGASLRGVEKGVIELRVPGGELVAAGPWP